MIEIPKHIIDAIFVQCKAELPNEACGLLTGNGTGDSSVVEKQYALTNIDHSPEHFSFDPKEQFAVLKEARSNGLRIVANYHSHPETPARPSEEDLRLAYDPNIIYIIVSMINEVPDIKAFSIKDGTSCCMEIKVT